MVSRTLPITVRTVIEADRQRIANLIHFETLVHRHLDWRPPLEWIGYPPYLLAERDGELLASLACPPDPPSVAWIRMFAVSAMLKPSDAWAELWPAALHQLGEHTPARVTAAIPLQRWFRNLLDRSDFTYTHSVQVLSWTYGELPPEMKEPAARIRPMVEADLPPVQQIDEAAFTLVWQNSYAALELAFQQAALATVAVAGERIIGYQISTATPMGGHLARLAVHPSAQGQGIGYDLVRDVLAEFKRRGAHNITVNTQHDNLASLAVYRRAGFIPTGEEYPVYQHTLA